MDTKKIERAVRELRQSVQRMKTHLAWLELERGQWRPEGPFGGKGYDAVTSDIRRERSCFRKLSSEVHEVLNKSNPGKQVPAHHLARFRREVVQLEDEMNRLSLPKPA